MIARATQQTTTASQEFALVRGAARGEQQCFDRLLELHLPRLRTVLFGMASHPSEVEDLVQEVLLKAFIHLNDFRGEARFSTWLWRIATNEVAQPHRRRRRHCLGAVDDLERVIADPLPSPHELLEKTELQSRVAKAIVCLPKDFHLPVRLFYLDGLTVRQTAERLGLSEGGVKARLFRARAKLAMTLKGYARGNITGSQITIGGSL